jgi:hypothetical protein
MSTGGDRDDAAAPPAGLALAPPGHRRRDGEAGEQVEPNTTASAGALPPIHATTHHTVITTRISSRTAMPSSAQRGVLWSRMARTARAAASRSAATMSAVVAGAAGKAAARLVVTG